MKPRDYTSRMLFPVQYFRDVFQKPLTPEKSQRFVNICYIVVAVDLVE